jgi:SSS family solute:Na+ symporter
MGIIDIVVAVLFMLSVIAVGMLKSKDEDTHNEETGASDYFLAGRGLSWWLIGFSLIAANISAEQFVGMSGQGAGLEGLSVASWEWIAAVTLVVVAFVLLPYFLKTGITTIPEFLEVRYNHWARLLMTISMTLILIGVSLIGVIYAGALTLTDLMHELGLNLNLTACCWALGLMAGLYVAFDGLKACAWADLLQGSALIIGGGVITYYAVDVLGSTDILALVNSDGTKATIDAASTGLARVSELNKTAMHMDTPAMPWPVLLLGIWIPNFYYWGLNQYITQRILGSGSLADGQKGLVLAAGLKLVVPFIIVIPGVIAFNLFSADMEERANIDAPNGNVFSIYEKAKVNPESNVVFKLDPKYAKAHPVKANEIEAYNMVVKKKNQDYKVEAINPYRYDTAMGLIITKLIPRNKGILGFVVAALLGAIISSLAAILNAASTLFTMDVYQRYINPEAPQYKLVTIGRICIVAFMIIGCLVAPLLVSFKSIFAYIQSFQGYVSTGILAVFIYGLLNRTSGKWAGVIGILANAIIYQIMLQFFPEVHFLYSMSFCLISVLLILFIYGLIFEEEEVVFESVTKLDMTPSKSALYCGYLVCFLTVLLYYIFW